MKHTLSFAVAWLVVLEFVFDQTPKDSIQAFELSTIHLVATGANPIFQEQFRTALSNSTTTGLIIIMKKLEGKVALVTGCSSGIGFATAKRFVTEGAYVFITGRRQTELDTAVKEIGENVTGVQSDVSNLADLDRLFARLFQEPGHLDVIFANAGGGEFAPRASNHPRTL